MRNKIRIGALISGTGSNLTAIMDACEKNKIDGDVVFAGADNRHAKGLDNVKKRGIPTFIVDYGSILRSYKKDSKNLTIPEDFDFDDIFSKQKLFSNDSDPFIAKKFIYTRVAAEAQLLLEMEKYLFDLLVLAGFMRTLTPYFIDRVNMNPGNPRIMNIHPALLPAFPGTDGYGDTFRYGCKVGGCTVHFIDYGEDTGKIIGQKVFSILPEDTLESVKTKGLKLEWELFPECIQMFAENKIF